MGKVIKCCINPICTVYHKKSAYAADDRFCIKCGQELYHVCKGKDTDDGETCFTILDSDKQKYCMRCEAVIAQRKEDATQKVKDVGGKALQVGGMAIAFAGPIADKGGKVVKAVGNVAKVVGKK